ncbi:flagellar protein FlhE [Klebsiella sp. BIGb0407]|uniref:flagellar protein FlhE n=1 Tax=Klebsiella sp. BIGb0407 TaxID=2940603 RepID=UPI00216A557D|nr:flagellar protein FlhE [Klebsiella sp. BIGb0407]MCS3433469.1 flagellar protein FlhE [Klebsiella sp. BIGb0407]
MRVLLLLLLLPLQASASGSGAWQASGMGATLSQRGIVVNSPALRPPAEVNGNMTLIAWRYQLMSPEPAGLRVKLCSPSRCVALDGPSGTTRGLAGISAGQPLIFVWEVHGRGSFYPPLRVSSNQVIVNYTP